MKQVSRDWYVQTMNADIGHKLISVAFKLAPAIAGLKFIYINLFIVANLF